ncbi:hypothetical protein QUF80_13800 [Desulfococcaceae bacterium HSG8]|nr:hypothetical protein [Desulfococcaceae bacterium HSG8]
MGSEKESITAEVNGRLDDLFGDGGEDDISDNSTETEAEERPEPPDDLGREKRGETADSRKTEAPQTQDLLTNDLKSVVLSLEWEITDQVMQKLGEEVEKLKEICKSDKIVIAFLQLLDSLGKYIQKKQAGAHPDSISLLNSVYENLETVMLSPDLSDSAKKKMLVNEVNKYKKLKVIITSDPRKIQPPAPEPEEVEKETDPDVIGTDFSGDTDDDDGFPTGMNSHQDVIGALEEINRTIKAEFRALREELKLWRERQ